jgi:TetR/AcrR family acrAB operon transcriptional repressor
MYIPFIPSKTPFQQSPFMVRRTKSEALETRSRLLDAAERLFQVKGVSGATRGAVYHHFKHKADLFNAMMERVTLPLECSWAQAARQVDTDEDPLGTLRAAITRALQQTAHDEHTRRVFEVATHKVEYTEELQAVRDRHLRVRQQYMAVTQANLEQAVRRQGLVLPVPLPAAALGLHVMIDGLIQNWLLDQNAFDLVACGCQAMDVYLAGLGFGGPEAPAAAATPRAHQPA